MKKSFYYILAAVLFITSCAKEKIEETSLETPMDPSEINEIVIQKLNENDEFRWNMVNDHVAWSALVNSDKILSIGYKPSDITDVHSIIHEIDIRDSKWTAARNELLEIIEETLSEDPSFDSKDHIYIKDKLPVVIVHTGSFELLEKLRANKDLVRYAEPMGYSIEPEHSNIPAEKSSVGCSVPEVATGIQSGDVSYLSPYSNIVPWTYTEMNIPQAWNYTTGRNVTVALFDTGTSNNQSKLRSEFDDGYSYGRYISPRSKHYTTSGALWWKSTTLDSPNDPCKHGTQMCGTIAAPRTAGGSVVGVAYAANVLAYRVVEDVIINRSSEKDAISNAFVEVALEGNAKIVSMSLGDPFTSSQVEDAIVFAYNYGLFIVCAAGTSSSLTNWYGVTFPASLPQTVAVTGVTDESNYERCYKCHSGSAVDFVVKMERSSERENMTLRLDGAAPCWVGGSSTATAQTAGVAALILSAHPQSTRNDILNRLKNASQNYPNRDSSYGYGTYDALSAIW